MMKLNVLKVLFLPVLLVPLFLYTQFFPETLPPVNDDQTEWIHAINIQPINVQRARQRFTLINESEAAVHWQFKIIDSDNGKIISTSADSNPEFSLREGSYDLLVTARGKNTLSRHYRRYITVLPKTFTEREADEVIDLDALDKNSVVMDYGNKTRPGYKIMIKGTYNGRFKITGLRGTKKKPVHIINKGQVKFNATNDNAPYAFQWSDNNQYILFDGKSDPTIPYGFIVTGHPKKSGQIFFIAGQFMRGFEVCGVRIIGRQGITEGASAIQLQTAYTPRCNASNWNFEYLKLHHNKIESSSTEGMYLGYFTDDARDGYIPYRIGHVVIYRDTIINSGWDAIQVASADEFEIHDNYIDGAGLSGKRNHSSFISWNSGNEKGWCYRNTFKNSAHAASIIYGKTGKEAYLYSNLFIEGTFPSTINTPSFFFSKLNNEFQSSLLYIFNNTIITSKIPAKVDYKNHRENVAIPVVFAGNAILMNRLNLKRYPDIAMGSNLTDSLSWAIDNVWRMQEKEAELKWNNDFYPYSDSPLINADFTIQKYITDLKGGFFDKDGYPLHHDTFGYSYGCYSAHQRLREPLHQ